MRKKLEVDQCVVRLSQIKSRRLENQPLHLGLLWLRDNCVDARVRITGTRYLRKIFKAISSY